MWLPNRSDRQVKTFVKPYDYFICCFFATPYANHLMLHS
jgi:hypothetical protein